MWRYANSYAFIRLLASDALAGITFYHITKLWGNLYFSGWAKSTLICMITLVTLFSRFAYQLWHSLNNSAEKQKDTMKNVAIIGAGQIGTMLANEMRVNHKSMYNPYCFVDIDKSKVGNNISGIEVLSADDNIIQRLKSLPIEEIIIALPKIEGEEKEKVYNFYKSAGLPIKIYDFALYENMGESSKRVIRDVKIEDLLFREPVKSIKDSTLAYYENKRVLVTGGGGSIGSELCRKIAKCRPKELIIIDNYENNAHEIYQELASKYGESIKLSVEIASVRDRDKLDILFEKYKPQIVFHAAAHKHVYLMENSPSEAVKNNVFGTKNTADMAEKHGCEKFILISTDKAVNPTNIMGASKRLCEMIVGSKSENKTSFSAVRFGNVLGSNGSVIHTFKKQIEKGGPITITDKRVIRYFMTIPEAVQLVMEAGVMAKNNELFVLDMGRPVKIVELAETMIRLHGFKPKEDIEITEIGLRPGEKLFEELLIKNDGRHVVTKNEKIFIERDTPLKHSEIEQKLALLSRALLDENKTKDVDLIKKVLKETVPSFCRAETVNENAESSPEMMDANNPSIVDRRELAKV